MGINKVVITDKQDSNRVILQDNTSKFITGVEYKIPFKELVSSNDNYYVINIVITSGSSSQEYNWSGTSNGWVSNIFTYKDI